ncbi:MAG: hypothetical protein AAF543_00950 [Pseudomonadota bacterium]
MARRPFVDASMEPPLKRKQRRKPHQSQAALRHGIETLAMTAAMPFAAMITLNHRLPILARAAAGADRSEDAEIERMTTEKVQAAGQMALALGGAVTASQQAVVRYGTEQARANAAFLGRSFMRPDQAFAFANESAERLTKLARNLSDIGSHSVAAALRPAHGKVTANAKRLARRKPT